MRRSVEIVIPPGFARDAGKRFALTEMPASQGEAWAVRAIAAMAKSNVDIPQEVVSAGWAAIAFVGIRSLLAAPISEVMPLLEEMMTCVKPAGLAMDRALVETDIEEIQTRAYLRDEVFKLHANFSLIGSLWTSGSSPPRAPAGRGRVTKTSRKI